MKRKAWSASHARVQQMADKRERILDAARDRFLAEGFSAASMDRIAEEAGASKMTLYRHFKSKEALFLAAINRDCAQIYAVEEHDPATTREAAAQSLSDFGQTFVMAITEPGVLGLFRMLMGEMARFPELGRLFYDAAPARSIAVIERILSGLLPAAEADMRARAFMHLLMGDTYQRLALGKIDFAQSAADFPAQISLAVELILSGIGKATPEERP
ncbi:TetR/AcrR family transcriptional regulator [Sphingobium phenoxybenzoativorans]|uniref:TetR/AcrR family transcriptional regulator n=1 Tax=Sphingobium phenoxybenzoativorans TaxID=1592790 RepID=UPI000A3F76F3|nr:TetR/AcrR family transcriptional regulator [Sphingobium phenoxybenzoativorans]